MTEIAMLSHTGSVEALTVGQVAQTFGVTVRTLHHYDAVGLLRPTERTRAGYRLYTSEDLQRLSSIVIYRRLGFALEEIGELLEADGAEVVDHLRRQRDLVRDRLAQMTELVDAIEHALEAEMTDQPATTEDLKALFGDGYNEEYQAEAQQRWGDTDKWEQSRQRQATMTKEDWARIKAETEAFEADLAAAVRDGVPTEGDVAATLAERHRASIERHYDCDHAFQVCLAQMYLADPRFTAHYEDIEPGTAQWLHDAIVANAARHTG
ncbi:MerR family transcriptional regulator [Janibacter cremeus]|uniref:DNA-binding transcriptional MerR regulator n=1 Tax=Janibacter cremeus TaxID=1285192 RepID=A0A852VS81_9MICO|nr:MerR family transcriptional regulator [Janibacter cremeus]NYF98290.1 DNA-binding transcriptional MerR regulator [Janibacter cremeus]